MFIQDDIKAAYNESRTTNTLNKIVARLEAYKNRLQGLPVEDEVLYNTHVLFIICLIV